MPAEPYTLISQERLPDLLASFCATTAADIVRTYKGYSLKSLRKRDITVENVREDFCKNLANGCGLDRVLSSPGFSLPLFSETLWYVLFWTDSVFQGGSDGTPYMEIRELFQAKLLRLASTALDVPARDLEGRLIARCEEYSFKPADNAISLMKYVTNMTDGEPLIFCSAAAAYVSRAIAETFGRAAIGRATGRGRFAVLCRNCSRQILADMNALPFRLACSGCGAVLDIKATYWGAGGSGQ